MACSVEAVHATICLDFVKSDDGPMHDDDMQHPQQTFAVSLIEDGGGGSPPSGLSQMDDLLHPPDSQTSHYVHILSDAYTIYGQLDEPVETPYQLLDGPHDSV